jgi:hypothetical protein
MGCFVDVPAGGYAYLPGSGLPFSNGVAALPGFALTRVRLRENLPLAEGLAFAARHIASRNRPAAALAACELRSPAAMTFADFATFNTEYAGLLRRNLLGDPAAFPVARSNMAPLYQPPATDTLFAFTYTEPVEGGGRDYVISGKPENTPESPGIVAPGDTTDTGMRAKAGFVLEQLRQRTVELGRNWADVTGAQIYTVHPLEPVMALLGASGLTGIGLSLFPGSPPIIGFAFEIDVRAVSVERVI